MLEGIKSILHVISTMISSLIAFFQFVGTLVLSIVAYINIMPLWLSVGFLAVVTILVVRLIVGR